ncbi:hypothetical protein QTL97_16090 [Sporosarcina thermotolerans]|uniref:Uncharacterized protein n=1 Tax=Sporosarcina thermotolerans TaxID=633404 RepID=A0AAW9AHB1_9BACL|nr:hypothetical protein [Sporosarcina thermotolerans]MDW0118451.1 hypothetical protein [Sporosarcina thermotolerans]WHT47712.1 hypothetical protein QNH10_16535 [Sporosarcina thermotolerans]
MIYILKELVGIQEAPMIGAVGGDTRGKRPPERKTTNLQLMMKEGFRIALSRTATSRFIQTKDGKSIFGL